MTQLRNLSVTALALSMLAACSSVDVASTRGMVSTGTAFQKSLHIQYANLAQEEADEGDGDNGVFFNDKAVRAAKAMDVQPQAVSARSVPAGTVQDLTSGRARLINAFARGAREKNPKLTARAQAMFDCWIEEQEENIQPDDIARCRSAFEQAMEFVGASLTVAAPAPAPAPAPAAPAPLPSLTGPYIVYFDFDSAEVKGIELGMVKRAALDAKEVGAISIVLSGHADRAGDSEYNMALSRARVIAVSNAIMEAGISRKMVRKSYLGEEEPAVRTSDGKRESMNRRVVIRLRR